MPFLSSIGISALNIIRGGGAAGEAVALLLDLYPNAAAAYSLRKLKTDYSGAAIEVRIDTTGQPSYDIGFDSNGELDTADLLSKAGANDAYITTRYDQSGNGHDLTQSSASQQPKIVNAGSIYTFNGKVYFLTDGTDDFLTSTTNPVFGTDPRSVFLVQKTNSLDSLSVRFTLSRGISSGTAWALTPEIAVRTNSITWISSTPTSTTAPSLISNIYTSGNLHAGNSMWLNGASVARTSGTDGTINTLDESMFEGASNSSANAAFDGYITESIIYKSDQSANRTDIETNINDYYNIYPSPSSFSFGNALVAQAGEFVTYASGLSAINNATQASIHAWVNVDSGDIAIVGSNPNTSERFSITAFSDDNLYLNTTNGSGSFGVVSFSPFLGTWALVSLVFDGSLSGNSNRLKCFINGLQQSLTFTGTIPSQLAASVDNFRINTSTVGSIQGNAAYDEMVVTTDASTPAQILNFYNSGNGALATDSFTNILSYWRCDEADGATTLADSVGTATGTLNNFSTPPAYFVDHNSV